MIIGVTASREITRDDATRIREILSGFKAPNTLVHGMCIGGDSVIASIASDLGWSTTPVVPADRSRTAEWTLHLPGTEPAFVMPEWSTYRDRNERIVSLSDTILAFPLWPEKDPRSLRSGTWQTVRIARRLERVLHIFPMRSWNA